MTRWPFRKKERTPQPPAPDPVPTGRFNLRPRTDVLTVNPGLDPALAAQLARLRQRRENVLFDVERSQEANQRENSWTERVTFIDEAIVNVARERATVQAQRGTAGQPLPPPPITAIEVTTDPSPVVQFTIGGEQFVYTEEIDWAERGFQLARVDLAYESGEIDTLVPATWSDAERAAVREHLIGSLFAFATELRNRTLAGDPLPAATLADLAVPDPDGGGWKEWGGMSPSAQLKANRLRELDAEAARLHGERAAELEEMARWADRLPIARRRLADVDAEIAALLGTGQ